VEINNMRGTPRNRSRPPKTVFVRGAKLVAACSPDGAQRNPGSAYPGLRCAPSGLRSGNRHYFCPCYLYLSI
jgi:hypothetical protein